MFLLIFLPLFNLDLSVWFYTERSVSSKPRWRRDKVLWVPADLRYFWWDPFTNHTLIWSSHIKRDPDVCRKQQYAPPWTSCESFVHLFWLFIITHNQDKRTFKMNITLSMTALELSLNVFWRHSQFLGNSISMNFRKSHLYSTFSAFQSWILD